MKPESDLLEPQIALLALANHAVATAVVDIRGMVVYANAAARGAFSLDTAAGANGLSEWTGPLHSLPRTLALIAGSSNWVPLKLTHREASLNVRARGIRRGIDGISYVLITSTPDATRPFSEHARQIRQLNRQIAKYQETEAKLRRSIELSRTLKREIVHRVKNNLAIVSSMLRITSRSIDDPTTTAALKEAEGRIMSIATVHEILDEGNETNTARLRELFTRMMEYLQRSIFPAHVKLRIDVPNETVHIDVALPLALVTNELVTNAIKYAFVGRAEGSVTIRLRSAERWFILTVKDDGIGIQRGEDGFIKHPRIVSALARQLNASIDCCVESGTVWTLRFPNETRELDFEFPA